MGLQTAPLGDDLYMIVFHKTMMCSKGAQGQGVGEPAHYPAGLRAPAACPGGRVHAQNLTSCNASDYPHDWASCAASHKGDKSRRRSIISHAYSPTMCANMQQVGDESCSSAELQPAHCCWHHHLV